MPKPRGRFSQGISVTTKPVQSRPLTGGVGCIRKPSARNRYRTHSLTLGLLCQTNLVDLNRLSVRFRFEPVLFSIAVNHNVVAHKKLKVKEHMSNRSDETQHYGRDRKMAMRRRIRYGDWL